MRARIRSTFLALGLLAAASCARPTPIGTLLSEGTEWDGRTVLIRGEVGDAVGILGFGAYQVEDGTGTVTVVSRGGGAPSTGTRVEVEGTFRVGFTVGPQTLSVIQEERRVLR